MVLCLIFLDDVGKVNSEVDMVLWNLWYREVDKCLISIVIVLSFLIKCFLFDNMLGKMFKYI